MQNRILRAFTEIRHLKQIHMLLGAWCLRKITKFGESAKKRSARAKAIPRKLSWLSTSLLEIVQFLDEDSRKTQTPAQ